MLGAVLGAGAAAGAIAWVRRRGLGAEIVEQWTWFLSPLILLPLVPALFRAKAWIGRHAELLPVVALGALAFEFLVSRSLANAPEPVRKWWAEVRSQVPAIVKQRGPLVLVVAASALYAAFFIFFTLRWHYKLRTGNYDLSINNNLMFGGLHGHFLESPVVFPKEPPRYLANHAKFGAYLFLPIYALFPRAETLLVIQSLFIGFGAVPLFLFARRHVSPWMAAIVCLAYLCYYPMHGASFSEFQAVPLTALFRVSRRLGGRREALPHPRACHRGRAVRCARTSPSVSRYSARFSCFRVIDRCRDSSSRARRSPTFCSSDST